MPLLSRRPWAGCLAIVVCLPAFAEGQDDLRAVDVKRFGISVRVPQAWSLIDWAQNDKAFVLRLPQENAKDDSPIGIVACELGVAPESLDEFHKRHAANDVEEQKRPNPRRKLTENRFEEIAAPAADAPQPNDAPKLDAAAQPANRRLVSIWQHRDGDGPQWFEIRTRLVSHDTLYTFVLTTDQAHYDSYRLDFAEMIAAAKFSPPETGLQRLPGGFWLQREFRFAMQTPEGWKPAFGPNDKVLFFATGASHEVFTDNLLVLASAARPLDLANLKENYAAAIAQADPTAEVEVCQIVPQGTGAALETVIHAQRGPFKISILERRFRGDNRNYEVKFTCETGEFKKLEAELRKSLDSFRELPDPAEKVIL